MQHVRTGSPAGCTALRVALMAKQKPSILAFERFEGNCNCLIEKPALALNMSWQVEKPCNQKHGKIRSKKRNYHLRSSACLPSAINWRVVVEGYTNIPWGQSTCCPTCPRIYANRSKSTEGLHLSCNLKTGKGRNKHQDCDGTKHQAKL